MILHSFGFFNVIRIWLLTKKYEIDPHVLSLTSPPKVKNNSMQNRPQFAPQITNQDLVYKVVPDVKRE